MKNIIKIFIFYFILTVIFTFPLILFFNSKIYGFPGDPFAAIYSIWKVKTGYLSLLPPAQPVLVLEIKFLSYFLSPVFVFNLLLFLSFPLAGLSTFLLVRYLTKNTLAAFISGLIFTFSPYHLFQGYQHLGLALLHWLVLYFLSLFYLIGKFNFKRVLLSVLFLALATLENYYYGYFLFLTTLIFAIFFGGYHLIFVRKINFTKIWPVALGLILFLALIFPITRYVFKNISQFSRERDQITVYSTNWREFVRPPIDHPIWGDKILEKARFDLHKSNFFEQTIFLGFLPLLLAFWGIYKNIRRKEVWLAPRSLGGVGFWVVLALAAGILSSPPEKLADLLYRYFPMFRVYARFSVLVTLSVAVLAGYGILEILKNRSKAIQWSVLAILSLLILFEFANFPPAKLTDVSQSKEVYQWISNNLPADSKIIEYPLIKSDEVRFSEYRFYQTLYPQESLSIQNKILPNDKKEKIYDPNSPEASEEFNNLNVDYLIIHKDWYREGRVPQVLWRYLDPSYPKYPSPWQGGEIPKIDNDKLELIVEQEDFAIYKIIHS